MTVISNSKRIDLTSFIDCQLCDEVVGPRTRFWNRQWREEHQFLSQHPCRISFYCQLRIKNKLQY